MRITLLILSLFLLSSCGPTKANTKKKPYTSHKRFKVLHEQKGIPGRVNVITIIKDTETGRVLLIGEVWGDSFLIDNDYNNSKKD